MNGPEPSPSDVDLKNRLRSLGNCEIFSSSRHTLGFYKRLANTCRYLAPTGEPIGSNDIHTIFEIALTKVVSQEASLCVGIAEESSNKSWFVRVDKIHPDDHLEWVKAGSDADLLQIIEDQQIHCFPDVRNRPPWKVTAV